MNDISTETLTGIANQLRIHSIAATTAAGSGHPSSCCSAADLVAALVFLLNWRSERSPVKAAEVSPQSE